MAIKQSIINGVRAINKILKKYHIVKWTIFLSLLFAVVFSGYLLFLAKTTNVESLKASMEQRTIIYDVNSQEAGKLQSQKGTYVTLDKISPNMVNAVLSTEDKRFYEHSGVDYMGIGRSVVGFFLNGFKLTGGGSTLTQQLAKNAYLTQKQTLIRKAQELFLAKEIEKVYSKDDILTMYLNHAYFGHGVWGVEDASKKYFGKSANDLTVSQAAILAGMLKSPTYYNPKDYKEQSKKRRNTVLKLMLDNQKITQEQYNSATSDNIVLKDTYKNESAYRYPYFFDAVVSEAANVYGISDEELFTKGYKIYTTLNQDYQKQLDKAYDATTFRKASDGVSMQSATVVADAKTGGISAMVGGVGEHTYRGFNRATQMYRQPGSTIKPLVVYTSAVELGYTPESIVLDEVKGYGSEQYTPKNANLQSVGSLPMYKALAESKNTTAVWLLDKIGLAKGIEKLQQFGISIEKEDDNLALALGGMSKGVTPVMLNNAYTAFADKGIVHSPYLITKIVDASGNVVVQKTYTQTNRVMSEETANTMTKMLLSVYESGGTGNLSLPYNYKVAGKTGTTENGQSKEVDLWSVAYTPDLVVTSWVGFDNPDDTHYLDVSKGDSIKPLFKNVVTNLLTVSPQTAFNLTSSNQDAIAKEKEEEEKKKDLGHQLNQFGEQIKKGISDTWKGVTDFFGGFFK